MPRHHIAGKWLHDKKHRQQRLAQHEWDEWAENPPVLPRFYPPNDKFLAHGGNCWHNTINMMERTYKMQWRR
jgi:hypothetical protein